MRFKVMLNKKLVLSVCFVIIFVCQSHASAQDTITHRKLFISLSIGGQMSGIKSEDFVTSNYSPLVKLSAGKWFSHELALRVGYQGFYYRAISDDLKHPYNYWFGESIFDVHNLLLGANTERIWSVFVHAGAGYLINNSEGQPNIIAATFAITNNFKISKKLSFGIDISSIMGWNIYQGDEDILPGIALGIYYRH